MRVYLAEREDSRRSQGLLAWAVRDYWGLSSLPEIAQGTHGKPFFPGRRDLHFNLSHSGSLFVCALGEAPLGVDVQMRRLPSQRLIRAVCGPEERAWLSERGDLADGFTLLWTLKESRCKQSGDGLSFPVSQISVPLPGEETEAVFQDGLWYTLHRGRDWCVCLCAMHRWDGVLRSIPAALR